MDGTEVVTALPQPRFGRFFDPSLTVMDDRLFFSAGDADNGLELWTSDGTAAGTRMVLDIARGALHAAPEGLAVADGRLYFSARDGSHGWELWSSDGTAAGTRYLHDIAPGAHSSAPERLTGAGGHLFFLADDGLRGSELWAYPLSGPAGCEPAERWACLAGGRFRAELYWSGRDGLGATARAAALSGDSGYFYFSNPANVEGVVKLLDGRSLNDHEWVFYGSLSGTEHYLTITDAETGLTRRYSSPAGRQRSFADTEAFGPRGASVESFVPFAPPDGATLRRGRLSRRGSSGPCVPDAGRLCLADGRFAVEATWRDAGGAVGAAMAVPIAGNAAGNAGYFWFFRDPNVELVVKVLDGRPVNGAHWVFAGGLSNLEVTLTVTDTETGAVRTYSSPAGGFASVGDTAAFPAAPPP